MVEPIFVINMVGYEISDCLLPNSKHVIFKLGINYGLMRDYSTHSFYVVNICARCTNTNSFQEDVMCAEEIDRTHSGS